MLPHTTSKTWLSKSYKLLNLHFKSAPDYYTTYSLYKLVGSNLTITNSITSRIKGNQIRSFILNYALQELKTVIRKLHMHLIYRTSAVSPLCYCHHPRRLCSYKKPFDLNYHYYCIGGLHHVPDFGPTSAFRHSHSQTQFQTSHYEQCADLCICSIRSQILTGLLPSMTVKIPLTASL